MILKACASAAFLVLRGGEEGFFEVGRRNELEHEVALQHEPDLRVGLSKDQPEQTPRDICD